MPQDHGHTKSRLPPREQVCQRSASAAPRQGERGSETKVCTQWKKSWKAWMRTFSLVVKHTGPTSVQPSLGGQFKVLWIQQTPSTSSFGCCFQKNQRSPGSIRDLLPLIQTSHFQIRAGWGSWNRMKWCCS